MGDFEFDGWEDTPPPGSHHDYPERYDFIDAVGRFIIVVAVGAGIVAVLDSIPAMEHICNWGITLGILGFIAYLIFGKS